jgi:hypothetical protein
VTLTRRRAITASCVLAVIVFAFVQDRVTAAGARRYAALAREAVASGRRPPVIEAIMTPAIRSSLLWGSSAAVTVLVVGAVIARALPRRAERTG